MYVKLSEDPDKYPEDLMKIESTFSDDYDRMNLFLEFFERIKELLFSRPEISIREIDFFKKIPKTTEILPFTYIIEINQKEYLLIFNDNSEPTINEEELKDYQSLFTNSKGQDGIIIIWNDNSLSSFKLYKNKIYSDLQEILKDFEVETFAKLLDDEINFRHRFIDLIEKQIKKISKSQAPDPTEQFSSYLTDTFENFKSKRFHKDKKKQVLKLNIYDINPFIRLFSNFILEKIDMEEFDKNFNEIISRGNLND